MMVFFAVNVEQPKELADKIKECEEEFARKVNQLRTNIEQIEKQDDNNTLVVVNEKN